jgi:hypothetical protein
MRCATLGSARRHGKRTGRLKNNYLTASFISTTTFIHKGSLIIQQQ